MKRCDFVIISVVPSNKLMPSWHPLLPYQILLTCKVRGAERLNMTLETKKKCYFYNVTKN